MTNSERIDNLMEVSASTVAMFPQIDELIEAVKTIDDGEFLALTRPPDNKMSMKIAAAGASIQTKTASDRFMQLAQAIAERERFIVARETGGENN